jgi:hypothetical protein
MDRVTQRLWRGVEGPRRCLFYSCCLEFSTTEHYRASRRVGPATIFSWGQEELASISHTYVLASHPVAGFGGPKAPSSMGKTSTAEVLRLRATSAVSRDPSVRRSAQDDESVGS